jgi:imidazole glycerol phosphate synthase glutamine amidotransferase subunit
MNTSPSSVAIVRRGSANVASVAAALERLGAAPIVTEDPDVVLRAPAAVLPGVGAFGSAADRLRKGGLDEAIRERVRRRDPLLAICLGMQLLCESSEESPGAAGLGIVPAHVARLSNCGRVPQMGWNRIHPDPQDAANLPLLRPDWMYFAHSFRITGLPPGWAGALTDYGGPFVSALEQGTLLACQFHPELSGSAGLALIRRWLTLAETQRVPPC